MQRPYGMFARGTDAEIGAGDQNLALLVLRLVEHEFRIATPCIEESVIETGLLDALEEHGPGMIWSVSTLERRSGTATPGKEWVSFSIF